MRPDRIVVGECRGGEAHDMVQALHTGHRGALTTCHANDPADALRRLETMVLAAGTGLPVEAVRAQVASALDLVVHVARGSGGRRRVEAVCEVVAAPAPAPGTGSTGGLRWLADARGVHAGHRPVA
jgi:pilus assembly protein CpaF